MIKTATQDLVLEIRRWVGQEIAVRIVITAIFKANWSVMP